MRQFCASGNKRIWDFRETAGEKFFYIIKFKILRRKNCELKSGNDKAVYSTIFNETIVAVSADASKVAFSDFNKQRWIIKIVSSLTRVGAIFSQGSAIGWDATGMNFQEFHGYGTGPGWPLENTDGTEIDLLIPVSSELSGFIVNSKKFIEINL